MADESELGHWPGLEGASGTATVDAAPSTARVAVVMPAYNEEALEEFLVEIEAALRPVTASLQFVVVDDASTDGLANIAPLPLGSRVDLLRNDLNLGHGPSALRAYAAGLATDPDLVIHVDGDGQFVGRDFVMLLQATAEGDDGVVGTRTGRREPWFRRVLTLGARVVTGFRGGDPNSPLRAYRAPALRRLLQSVSPDSVVPHLHFTVLHDRLGLNVGEIGVTHQPRRGRSSLGTTWRGSRTAAVLPGRRLLHLSWCATFELIRRGGVGFLLAAALAVVVIAAVVPAFGMPLNYDEAYNLQVVTNLLHGHGYATDGSLFSGHPQLFDYRITTGPALMLPTAAAAALFGEHLWVYRIFPALTFAGLLAVWWVVGRRLAGPRFASVGGAASVLGVLALATAGFVLDSPIGPGTVIGDTTATFFVLMAIVLARRPGWSGLCLGLAVMTKVLVLVAVPGVALAVAMIAGRSRAPRALAVLAGVAAVPVLLWQMVRIASLGWSGAMGANGEFLRFLHTSGVGLPNPVDQLGEQVHRSLGFGAVAVLLAACVVAARLASGWRPRLAREDQALVAGILVAGAAFEGYWLLMESQKAVRHSYQAGQLLMPLALVVVVRTLPGLRVRLLRNVAAVTVGVLIVAQTTIAVRGVWNPPGPSLAQQHQVADLVAAHGSSYRFSKISMAPEVTFFRPDLHPRPLDGGGERLLMYIFGPYPLNECAQILVRRFGYVLCEVGPIR